MRRCHMADSASMSTDADAFFSWAADPSRTLEERFGILRFAEFVYQRHYTGPDKQPFNFEADRLRQQDRRYNAAFEPVLKEPLLRITAGLLGKVVEMDIGGYQSDRILRDLTVLRFVPALTSLRLGGLEMDSLDFLRFLPALHTFHLREADRVEDYSALATCRELRVLHLHTPHPWPDFSGLETLPHLEEINAHMSIRAFAEIPALPVLLRLNLQDPGGYGPTGCLRDCHQLPHMPLLQQLEIHSLYRLDGIDRFPRLRAAIIWGYFRALAPVAAMPALTHLRIACDEMQDISAAAAMPALHHFALRSIRPQDWTSLMDSTTLREAFADGCTSPQPDLDTLRLVLPPRSDLFGIDPPRPLHALRLFCYEQKSKDPSQHPPADLFPDGPAGWNGCSFMRESEKWCFKDLIKETFQAAGLGRLPGIRLPGIRLHGYGGRRDRAAALCYSVPHESRRGAMIKVLRVEAISRLRDIVHAIRTAFSQTRHPWHVSLILDAEPDADEWDEDWRDSSDTPQERAMERLLGEQEREREQERLRLFLADQHRLALLKEQGTPPAPGEIGPRRLAPAKPLPPIFQPPAPTPAAADDSDEDDGDPFSNDPGGGIAEADPEQDDANDEKWLAPVEISDPNVKWNGLHIYLTVTESAVWCNDRRDIESVSYLLDLPPERPPSSP